MVWKRDLILEQLRCATGEELGYVQEDGESKGYALECRINAEDPEKDFEASPGKIERFIPPSHRNVQIDTFIPIIESSRKGYQISTAFDSLLANVIVWGKDKRTAINLMRRTLGEFEIEGKNVKTTIPFHLEKLGEL
jgi:acetyl-CoA carboxylase biotin carboxylase subunit